MATATWITAKPAYMFIYMRYKIVQATLLLHRNCVEIQVNTETKLICISRHGPTRHAASNAVVKMQVIAVEMQLSVTQIQVVFSTSLKCVSRCNSTTLKCISTGLTCMATTITCISTTCNLLLW